ncbi:MAG: precorrin-6y C5,15-methyltransferase (decarboxylating) subunit CbiE, partial [Oscillospiraceae bacterium]
MKKISVVGCSMGYSSLLTEQAKETIKNSQLIIGSDRILETLSFSNCEKIASKSATEIIKIVEECDDENIVIAVSGDTGFFSMAKIIGDKISEKNLQVEMEFVCGISSMCYFFNALQKSYTNCQTISIHGRKISVANTVLHSEKTFGITSTGEDMEYVFDCLIKGGFGDVPIFIGENLSYEDEIITKGTPNSLKGMSFGGLCVFLVENHNP